MNPITLQQNYRDLLTCRIRLLLVLRILFIVACWFSALERDEVRN